LAGKRELRLAYGGANSNAERRGKRVRRENQGFGGTGNGGPRNVGKKDERGEGGIAYQAESRAEKTCGGGGKTHQPERKISAKKKSKIWEKMKCNAELGRKAGRQGGREGKEGQGRVTVTKAYSFGLKSTARKLKEETREKGVKNADNST